MMVTGKNWKVRKDGKPKMDENTQARFDEKLTGLLAVARKKKNVLEYQEVAPNAREKNEGEKQRSTAKFDTF